MKHTQRNGFAMIAVLLIMSLLGLTMTVLSSSSRQMGHQTTSEVLKVNSRNIMASGIAWARTNKAFLNKQATGFTTELDTTAFDIPKASCTLRIDNVTDEGSEVTIEAVCYKGRRRSRESYKLQI